VAGLLVGVHRRSGDLPDLHGETSDNSRALPAADCSIEVNAAMLRVTMSPATVPVGENAAAPFCAALVAVGKGNSFDEGPPGFRQPVVCAFGEVTN
jgi:hypothetical protein